MKFLPTTPEEFKELGWSQADIILVSGDTYIDSPFIGVALIGRVLTDAGFKVGIIAQPALDTDNDIKRLGEPRLFWGVSGGSVDSMVANFTASNKHRNTDDFTPGGLNSKRPDRAVIAYSNLIRRSFKNTKPIVLGGIEASLRRLAHYDFWSNKIRKSILFDAKADILLYGMAEKSVLALAEQLKRSGDFKSIPGLCYAASSPPHDFIELPSFDEVATNPEAMTKMFHTFYQNNDPLTAKGLTQRQDAIRYLVQNPPSAALTPAELDHIHELPFSRSVHPYYQRQGKVRAQDTIQFALSSHRGCYGECNFCAIAIHQGRTVCSRSEASILREARGLTLHADFKGNILDVGGPTANMYGFECAKKLAKGVCAHRRCLTPSICPSLKIDHRRQLGLLQSLQALPGVKRVFVASGIRYDLILADPKGIHYLKAIVNKHISGQMKVAPEHSETNVLAKMGKPSAELLLEFKKLFERCTKEAAKEQYLTYYFIAAHPGCAAEDMARLHTFCRQKLSANPEQVQIFTPTPSTYSSLMYWTKHDPFDGSPIFVETDKNKKEAQKFILTGKRHLAGQTTDTLKRVEEKRVPPRKSVVARAAQERIRKAARRNRNQ
ncbi:MAG: YgiQ family radical SAM protein [Desulfobulbaceae bacterium]|nr:YgiQ family radical SAM protein [Desulfobulbaceae bacterium]